MSDRPRLLGDELLLPRTSYSPAQLSGPAVFLPGRIPTAGIRSGDLPALVAAWYDVSAFAGVAVELVPSGFAGVSSAGILVALQWTDDPANVVAASGNFAQYVARFDPAIGTVLPHRVYVRNRGRYLNVTLAQNGGMAAGDSIAAAITPTYADLGPDLSMLSGFYGAPDTLVPMIGLAQVAVAAGASSTVDFHGGGPAVLSAWSATAGGGTYRYLLAIYDSNGNRTTYVHQGVAAAAAGAHSFSQPTRVILPPGTHRLQVVNTAAAAQQLGASLLLDPGIGV